MIADLEKIQSHILYALNVTADPSISCDHLIRDFPALTAAWLFEFLKQAGLFAGWVADCPLTFSSPNAPSKHDLLGTVLLSILSGHYRYAHITALRCDAVNPRLLGMKAAGHEEGGE